MINNLNKFIEGAPIKTLLILSAFILSLSVLPSFGQDSTPDSKQQNPKPSEQKVSLFDSDELLNVTLNLDLARFSKKPSKGDSFEALMTIYLGGIDSINKKIIINYRGTSRFQICSFPPIQINLEQPIYTGSGKIKKMKLVTHCESGSLTDEYVLREYLVYKLYNVLTDTSFRVRLLKVKYVDTNKNKKTIIKYGIFIEPIELLADRTNSAIVKLKNLNMTHVVPSVMDRVAIFNYMISNFDWSIPGQHNVVLIKKTGNNNSDLVIAVPYDFDYTGVVNADYAIPPPDLGIENIRNRLFRGICRSKEVYQEDLKNFLNYKVKLYSVINENLYLSQRSKKDITTFLDQFFDKLEKQKSIDNLINIFLDNCKK